MCLLCADLTPRKASGVSCWREGRPSVWERVKDAGTLTWTLRYEQDFCLKKYIFHIQIIFFRCDQRTSFVSLSRRGSSGSTIGITTSSCPSCSTGWVSRCPAGSEKSWSTPGSSTAGGDHSSTHWTTAPRCWGTLAEWPEMLKIPNSFDWNIWRFEEGMPNSKLNCDLPKWTGQQWIVSKKGAQLLSAADGAPLSLSLSFETLLLPCRTNQDHGSPNDGLHSVLEKEERLSDAQERPSVFDNHNPCSP